MGPRRLLRIARWLFARPRPEIHTEIDRVRAALRRHQAVVDEMRERFSRERMSCCPSCAFGSRYTKACDQCERTAEVLVRLLRKRGRPEDLARARSLEFDYPPKVTQITHRDLKPSHTAV
jgi:hypothetical protein